MSCYNWESGKIKFSTKEWTAFKKKFREGFNKLQDAEMAAATRHWEKYKGGPVPKDYLGGAFYEEKQRFDKIWQKWIPKEDSDRGSWGSRNRPRKPIRKDYPLVNNKQTKFHFDEAEITFDNEAREVHYYSGDNNRQVERARNHEVGQLFFRLLGEVTWMRGTGGQLIGNDEYNQDQDGVGGGGNYVTFTYSQEEQKRAKKFSNNLTNPHSWGIL